MNKIFIDANEKYVSTVVMFGQASDTKLYVDEACAEQATNSVVLNAAKKGLLLVNYDGAFYNPVKFAEASGVTTVTLWGSSAAVELVTTTDPEEE